MTPCDITIVGNDHIWRFPPVLINFDVVCIKCGSTTSARWVPGHNDLPKITKDEVDRMLETGVITPALHGVWRGCL